MTPSSPDLHNPRPRRRFRVEFQHRCALSLPRVQVATDDLSRLPGLILDDVRDMPTIPGVLERRAPVTVAVEHDASAGRLVVDERVYPFRLVELDPQPAVDAAQPQRCTACGNDYEDPPTWLVEFVRPGLCWRCG